MTLLSMIEGILSQDHIHGRDSCAAVAQRIHDAILERFSVIPLNGVNTGQVTDLIRGVDADIVVKPIQAYFDGNGNVEFGGHAQGLILWSNGLEDRISTPQNGLTNNELEYKALITVLETLIKAAPEHQPPARLTDVAVMGDSKLVVEQTNGAWRVSEKRLLPYRDQACMLLAKARTLYKTVALTWVRSAENLVDRHA